MYVLHRTSRLLCWLLVLGATPAFGQSLFSPPVDPAAFGLGTAQEQAEGLRHRFVRVNLGAVGPNVRLNLFDDVVVDAEQERAGRHLQTTTWAGRVEGDPFSSVILAYHDDGALFGKVEFDGRQFQIQPRGQGIHAIVEMAPLDIDESEDDAIPFEGAGKQGAADPQLDATGSVCEVSSTCSAQVVDIMVVYTANARSKLGGSDASSQAEIAAAVSEMNLALQRAGVSHSFNLVHAAPVGYTESGSASTDLSRLANSGDGYMDEVHTWRNQYGADLVSLIVDFGGCGVGYLQTNTTTFNSAAGFNVADDSCMRTNKTLAHEVGHNVSLRHDHYRDGSTTPCAWHHGYVNQEVIPDGGTSSSERWRTIMAYNSQCAANGFNCSRIAYYSNANGTYNGDPLGRAQNLSQPADAAFALERSLCKVADFRSSATPNAAPVVSISAPSDGASFTEGSSVGFTGTASDTEDGSLSSSLSWTSNIDGPIGGGASFSTAALSPGTHVVTASVTDSGGKSDSEQVSVTINALPNDAPTVSITAPSNGATFASGATIQFTGTASDTEDGDLSGSIQWTSSIDGALGGGASVSVVLSAGTHTVTASVTDSGGKSANDAISVTVEAPPNTDPTVAITAPADGATFTEGSSVGFTGTASDAEDGNLSGSIAWSSSIDGSLGTGASISASLSAGTHTITALVTDAGGSTANDAITVNVEAAPPATRMYIADVSFGSQGAGKGRKKGVATVTVRDEAGNLVDNVTVDGLFNGTFSEPATDVTNGSGVANLETVGTTRDKQPSIDFCVADLTHASLTYDGSLNPVASFDCEGGGNPLPSGPAVAHVELITASLSGNGQKRHGEARVTVYDADGQPVSGVEVQGQFSGTFSESRSGITSASGMATIQTSGTTRQSSATVDFCVSDLVRDELTYDSGANTNTGYACGGAAKAALDGPAGFRLEGNYPNPFNPTTMIRFTLDESADVQLSIYTVEGREVERLVNGRRDAGRHEVRFDASRLSAGVYVYVLHTPQGIETRRMTLLK